MRAFHPNKEQSNTGFTLIELLVVISIILILMGLLFSATGWVRNKAITSQTESLLIKVANALEMHQQDWGRITDMYNWDTVQWYGYPLVGSFSAGSWNSARTNGDILYREIVSVEPYAGGRPRPGYLFGQVLQREQEERDGLTYLIDGWGNPLIYVARSQVTGRPGQHWPDGLGSPKPLPGFQQRYELWSAGRDGQFDNLRGNGVDADNIGAHPYHLEF